MSDSSDRQKPAMPWHMALYPALLGGSWHDLHDELRCFHDAQTTVHAVGVFQVLRGAHGIARMLAWVARLPAAGEAVEVRLVVTPRPEGEEWRRTFAGRPLVSMQYPGVGGLLRERMGLLEMRFRLHVVDKALHYETSNVALRVGPLCVKLPRWLSPRVTACERATGDGQQIVVNVETILPLLGRLISYAGTLRRVEAEQ